MSIFKEIRTFLLVNWPKLIEDAKEFDGLDLTVACDNDLTKWNYQTGDNSCTGGAYGLQHWAVTTITEDSCIIETFKDIENQLLDLIEE